MSLESAVREEIEKVSQLTNKVFPIDAPENFAAPYATFVSSAGVNTQSLDGVLSSKELEFEVHILSASYAEMKTITSGVVQYLLSFQGRMIGTTAKHFVQEIDINDNPLEMHDKATGLYRCVIEFILYV